MRTYIPLLLLLSATLLVSCATGSNTIGSDATINERYAAIEAQQQAFAVNIIPPEGGRALLEGKEIEAPYSARVTPGQTYQIEIDTPEGTAYKGNIKVLGEGGSIGRHQGYDVRLSRYIMEMLKHDRQVSFYLNSNEGKQVLLVTFYAP